MFLLFIVVVAADVPQGSIILLPDGMGERREWNELNCGDASDRSNQWECISTSAEFPDTNTRIYTSQHGRTSAFSYEDISDKLHNNESISSVTIWYYARQHEENGRCFGPTFEWNDTGSISEGAEVCTNENWRWYRGWPFYSGPEQPGPWDYGQLDRFVSGVRAQTGTHGGEIAGMYAEVAYWEAGQCGNRICEEGETPVTCSADCGKCGNFICEAGEQGVCLIDCQDPGAVCGNNVCEPSEMHLTCGQDCPAPTLIAPDILRYLDMEDQYVVFQRSWPTDQGLYYFDLSTQETHLISTAAAYPDMDDHKVAYGKSGSIFVYDFETGTDSQVSNAPIGTDQNAEVHGDYVIWERSVGNQVFEVWLKNLETQEETYVGQGLNSVLTDNAVFFIEMIPSQGGGVNFTDYKYDITTGELSHSWLGFNPVDVEGPYLLNNGNGAGNNLQIWDSRIQQYTHHIETDNANQIFRARLNGDKVVYAASINGHYGVTVTDINTNSHEFYAMSDGYAGYAAMSGDDVVFSQPRNDTGLPEIFGLIESHDLPLYPELPSPTLPGQENCGDTICQESESAASCPADCDASVTNIAPDAIYPRFHRMNDQYIVWQDYRQHYAEDGTMGRQTLYAYDRNTDQETAIPGSYDTLSDQFDLDGSRVVFAEETDILLYDLSTGEETTLAASAQQERDPSLSGNYVVYERGVLNDAEIVLQTISTGEELTIGTGDDPLVRGNHVLYSSGSSEFLYNIDTQETTNFVDDALDKAMDDNGIVMMADTRSILQYYDFETGLLTDITHPERTFQSDLNLEDGKAVYRARIGDDDHIIWKDVEGGTTLSFTLPPITFSEMAYHNGAFVHTDSAAFVQDTRNWLRDDVFPSISSDTLTFTFDNDLQGWVDESEGGNSVQQSDGELQLVDVDGTRARAIYYIENPGTYYPTYFAYQFRSTDANRAQFIGIANENDVRPIHDLHNHNTLFENIAACQQPFDDDIVYSIEYFIDHDARNYDIHVNGNYACSNNFSSGAPNYPTGVWELQLETDNTQSGFTNAFDNIVVGFQETSEDPETLECGDNICTDIESSLDCPQDCSYEIFATPPYPTGAHYADSLLTYIDASGEAPDLYSYDLQTRTYEHLTSNNPDLWWQDAQPPVTNGDYLVYSVPTRYCIIPGTSPPGGIYCDSVFVRNLETGEETEVSIPDVSKVTMTDMDGDWAVGTLRTHHLTSTDEKVLMHNVETEETILIDRHPLGTSTVEIAGNRVLYNSAQADVSFYNLNTRSIEDVPIRGETMNNQYVAYYSTGSQTSAQQHIMLYNYFTEETKQISTQFVKHQNLEMTDNYVTFQDKNSEIYYYYDIANDQTHEIPTESLNYFADAENKLVRDLIALGDNHFLLQEYISGVTNDNFHYFKMPGTTVQPPPEPEEPQEPGCGDNICQPGESSNQCPIDCPVPQMIYEPQDSAKDIELQDYYAVFEHTVFPPQIILLDRATNTSSVLPPLTAGRSTIRPGFDGDWVIWEEYIISSPTKDIIAYNIQTEEHIVLDSGTAVGNADVDGEWAIWEDSQNVPKTVYLHNLNTGEEFVLIDDRTSNQYIMEGGYVVIADSHVNNGVTDSLIYSLSDRTFTTPSVEVWHGMSNGIDDDKLIWVKTQHPNREVHLYDLQTNQDTILFDVSASSFQIGGFSDGVIHYTANIESETTTNSVMRNYYYDINTGETKHTYHEGHFTQHIDLHNNFLAYRNGASGSKGVFTIDLENTGAPPPPPPPPPSAAQCGNSICDESESAFTCSMDCGSTMLNSETDIYNPRQYDVSQEYVVWGQRQQPDTYQSNPEVIYKYEIATQTEELNDRNPPVCDGGSCPSNVINNQGEPAIEGNTIVYSDTANKITLSGILNSADDIFASEADESTSELISRNSRIKRRPSASNNYFAWLEYGHGSSNDKDAWVYNRQTDTKQLIASGFGGATVPLPITDDYIVVDNNVLDIETAEIIATFTEPYSVLNSFQSDLDGDNVIYTNDGQVYLYDIETGSDEQISDGATDYITPYISGDYATWTEPGSSPKVHLYKISTGEIIDTISDAQWGKISGSNIAYKSRAQDLYLYSFADIAGEPEEPDEPEQEDISFFSPLTVVRTTTATNPDAAGNDGTAYYAWVDTTDGNNEIYYSEISNDGEIQDHKQRVTDNVFNSLAPSTAVLDESLYIAWQEDRDGNNEIYLAEAGDEGERKTFNSFSSVNPTLRSDENLHLFWQDSRDGQTEVYHKEVSPEGDITGDTRLTWSNGVIDYAADYDENAVVFYQDPQNNLHLYAANDFYANATSIDTGSVPAVATDGESVRIVYNKEGVIHYALYDHFQSAQISPLALFSLDAEAADAELDSDGNLHVLLKQGASSFYFKISEQGFLITPPEPVIVDGPNAAMTLADEPILIWQDLDTNLKFATTETVESNAPSLQNVVISDINDDRATISWDTDEPADAFVSYGEEIGDSTLSDTLLGTDHEFEMTGLEAGKSYLVRVSSTDAAGNVEASSEMNFSTPTLPNPPELPTSVYGRVQDSSGGAIGDVEVQASWIDANDQQKVSTTSTITEEDAEEQGNPVLAGFYLFNQGEIKAKAGSTITITASDLPARTVQSSPGGSSVQADAWTMDQTPPTLTIVTPESTSYTTPDLQFRYTTSETLDDAYFTLNGGAEIPVTGMDDEDIPITAQFGSNTLVVYGEDAAGLQGSDTVTFSVDDTDSPTVSVQNPGSQSKVISLVADVADGNELAQSCEVCLNYDNGCPNWIDAEALYGTGSSAGQCRYIWNTVSIPTGTYNINFRVSDTSGNVGEGEAESIFIDRTPPGPINFLVQAAENEPTITVTWDELADDDLHHYAIYRSLTPFTEAPTDAHAWANETGVFVDADLQQQTTYYYAVTGVDIYDNEDKQVQSKGATTVDLTAPVIDVSQPEATTYATTTIPLEFTANEPVTSCTYSLNDGPENPVSSPTTISVEEGIHILVVRCIDDSGFEGQSSPIPFTVDVSAPGQVDIVNVEQTGPEEVSLEWEQSDAVDFKSYHLYREDFPFNDVSQLNPIDSINSQVEVVYVDEDVEDEELYYYAVAVEDQTDLMNNNVNTQNVFVEDQTPPDAVENIEVSTVPGQLALDITWNDINANDFAAYKIYRADDRFEDTEQAAEIASLDNDNAQSYRDEGLNELQTYYYTVVAEDDNGNALRFVDSYPGTVADAAPPTIDIVTPVTETVYLNPVPLRYTSDEVTENCRYVLNEGAEVPIAPQSDTCQKIIGGYDFYNDDSDPRDDHGHGTHVAATAAGQGSLNGIAPDANILVYKVLGAGGSGSFSDVIAGIEQAVEDGADVISMSLGGGRDPDSSVALATDIAYEAGVLPVVSAGNSGPSEGTIGCPGCARKAFTIGASDKSDRIASFSSRGPTPILQVKPDVTAPGVSICAAQWANAWASRECIDNEHTSISGTSMAAPHVSGAAALVMQAHPTWTVEEVAAALKETAIDIGEPILTQGTGRIDVQAAVDTQVLAFPSTLDYGLLEYGNDVWEKTETLTIKNVGDTTDTFTVSVPTLPQGLSIIRSQESVTLLPGQSADISMTVAVQIDVLSDGTYEGDITITGSQNSIRVPYFFIKSSVLEVNADDHMRYLYVFGTTSEGEPFATYKSQPGENAKILVPSGTYGIIVRFQDYLWSKYYVKDDLVIDDVLTVQANKAEVTNRVVTRTFDETGVARAESFYKGWMEIGHESGFGLRTSGVRYITYFNDLDSAWTVSQNPIVMANGKQYDPRYLISDGLTESVTLSNDYEDYLPITYQYTGAPSSATLNTATGSCLYESFDTWAYSICVYYGSNNIAETSPHTRQTYVNKVTHPAQEKFRTDTFGDWIIGGAPVYAYQSGMILRKPDESVTVTNYRGAAEGFVERPLNGNTVTIDVKPYGADGVDNLDVAIKVLDFELGRTKTCTYQYQGDTLASEDDICNDVLNKLGATTQNLEEPVSIIPYGPDQDLTTAAFGIFEAEEPAGGSVDDTADLVPDAEEYVELTEAEKEQHRTKVIVEFEDTPTIDSDEEIEELAEDIGVTATKTFTEAITGMATSVNEEQLQELLENPNVKRIIRDEEVSAFLTESADLINAPQLWARTSFAGQNLTGLGVTIAIIDTGTDPGHVDFSVCNADPFVSLEGQHGENVVRVLCEDESGNTGQSDNRVFTVDAAGPAPIIPELTFDEETTTVSIEWDAVPDLDFKSYSVYKSTEDFDTIEEAELLETILDQQDTSVVDQVTAQGGTFYYAVTASDVGNNQNNSVQAEMIVVPDTEPPDIQIKTPRGVVGVSGLVLTYTAAEPVVNCRYTLDDGPAVPTTNETPINVDEGVHNISLFCDDLEGLPGTATSYFSADLTPPPVLNVEAELLDDTTVHLSWEPSEANDFWFYRIYRDTEPFTNVEGRFHAASFDDTEYTDDLLDLGTTYYYVVNAVDLANNDLKEVEPLEITAQDQTPPEIALVEPLDGAVFGNTAVEVEIDSSETTDECIYTLNGANQTMVVNPQTITALVGANTLQVHCSDEFDNWGSSEEVSFAVDTTPPEQVSGVNAVADPEILLVTVSWNGVADQDVAEYNVYRSTSDFSDVSEATLVESLSSEGYIDINVESETTYYYGVVAEDAVGNARTDVETASATSPDLNAPGQLDYLASPVPGEEAIFVSWNTAPEQDVDHYTVYRSLQDFSNAGSAFDIAEIPVGTTNYLDEAVQSDTQYFYAVVAVDTNGNEDLQVNGYETRSADLTPPTVTIDSPEAQLYDSTSIPFSYSVSEQADCSYSLNGGDFIDASTTVIVAQEGANTLFLECTDNSENKGNDTVSFTVDTPPDKIQQVNVNAIAGQNSLVISWPSSGASDFDHYNLYRSESLFVSTEDAQLIATLTDVSYVDTGLVSEEEYYYGVAAVDTAGQFHTSITSYSGTVADTIPPDVDITSPLPGSYTTTTHTLTFTLSETASCEYRINDGAPILGESGDEITAVEGNNVVLVSCLDEAQNNGSSTTQFNVDTTPPGIVQNLAVDNVANENSLMLTWDANSEQDLAGYNVYRSLAPFNDAEDATLVGSTSQNAFTDTNLVSEETYYYGITAHDVLGNENTQVLSVGNTVSDIIPPEITITSPTDEVYTSKTVPLIFNVNEDTQLCTFAVNNGPDVVTDGIGTLESEEGENTVVVNCTDLAGNMGEASKSYDVNAEAPPPITNLVVVPVPGEAALELSWDATPATDLKNYVVYRQDTPFNDTSQAIALATTTGTSIQDTTVISDTTYYYAITAIDTLNNENTTVVSKGATVPDLTPPIAIQGVTVETVPGTDQLRITWVASSAEDFAQYNVYRKNTAFTSVNVLTPIGIIESVNDTEYFDSGLESETTYHYAVTAIDILSNELKAVQSVPGTTADLSPPGIIVQPTSNPLTGTTTITAQVEDSTGLSRTCLVCVTQDSCNWAVATSNFNEGDLNGTCSYEWDTSGGGSGDYEFNFQVTDVSNNSGTGDAQSTTVIDSEDEQTVNVPLEAGWNLISLPLIPSDGDVEQALALISGNYNRIYAYDEETQIWTVYNPDRTIFDPENTLSSLALGKGYWIDMSGSGTLQVTGFAAPFYERDLISGWNIVGHPYAIAQSADTSLQSISGSYTRVFAWNAVAQKWDIYRANPSPSQPNTFDTFTPGHGYLVHMTANNDWMPPQP